MADRLKLNPGTALLLGYGSLLLKSSMERTLGRPYDLERYTCHVSGWKRTWNSLYPNNRYYYHTETGKKVYPRNILYLNISPSSGLVNGVAYLISDSELAEFDGREAVYDRVDVCDQVIDLEVTGGPVWAYVGKPGYTLSAAVGVKEAAIRKSYIDTVENGLNQLGQAFKAEYGVSTDSPPEANIIDDCLD
jgi:hypothetical protein